MTILVSLPGLLQSTEGYSEEDLRDIVARVAIPCQVTTEILSPSVQIRGGSDPQAAQDLFSQWCRALEHALTEFDTR